MKNLLTLFIFVMLILSISSSQAVYIGGSTGYSYSFEKKSNLNHHLTHSLYVGGSILPMLKIEGLGKYNKHLLVGGGARLTVFPFVNLAGGVVQRFTLDDTHRKNGTGGYFGPSINFNLIPLVDIFADGKYFVVSGDKTFDAEVGVRLHF